MLKNLKSLFILEEEGSQAAAKPTKTPETPSRPASPASSPSVARPAAAPSYSSDRVGQVTTKFTEVLLEAMDRANLDGFDYLEYKKGLANLRKMSMDEATRYQSAFALGQTMGATPDHLVNSAQHYLTVLAKEEQQFEQALANQQKVQIGGKEKEQEQLQQTVAAKAAKIKELEAEIEAHRTQLETVARELNENASRVESTKNDFIASYQNLVSQIQQDIENMRQYLK